MPSETDRYDRSEKSIVQSTDGNALAADGTAKKQQAHVLLEAPPPKEKLEEGPWDLKQSNALFTKLQNHQPISDFQGDLAAFFVFGYPKDEGNEYRDMAAIWIPLEKDPNNYKLNEGKLDVTECAGLNRMFTSLLSQKIIKCTVTKNCDRKKSELFVRERMEEGGFLYGKWLSRDAPDDIESANGMAMICGFCQDHGTVVYPAMIIPAKKTKKDVRNLLVSDLQYRLLKFWSNHPHSGYIGVLFSCPGMKDGVLLK